MTRRSLRRTTARVVVFYALVVATAVVLRVRFPDSASGRTNPVYATYKDVLPLLIAIPAAWLGYCFQRRSSYLTALRSLWDKLIPAVQQALQYTHLAQPTQEQFAVTMRDLATVTDSLRGVFKNIPNEDPVGLYPYENLKDIVAVISWLGFASPSEHDRYWARRCVLTLWASMHQALLLEFDREVPALPLSKYLDGSPSVADRLKQRALTEDHLLEEHRLQRERLIEPSIKRRQSRK